MPVSLNKDLLEKILEYELKNAKDIAVIIEKCEILDKLDESMDELSKDLVEYKLITNRRISEHETKMAHIEEKVGNRATLITMIGGIIAIIISFLIAFFSHNAGPK